MNPIRNTGIALLRATGLYHPMRDLRRDAQFRKKSAAVIEKWIGNGRPPPPPDAVKYGVIRSYAERHGLKVLVETGTFYGDAIFTLRKTFREIHSVELAPGLHASAVAQLRHLGHIHIHLGDSARELPSIAASLKAPAIFWLDGHFCAGPSARGSKDTPVFEELDYLLGRPAGKNVVLIDDARLFNGSDGYPTIDELRLMVKAKRPDASFDVELDIIRIIPV
jgi:hypothetical protein